MPKYVQGEEKKYFPMMIAALIAGAIVIAGFIYSLVKNADKTKIGSSKVNVMELSPGGKTAMPKTAPYVAPPTTPPPAK